MSQFQNYYKTPHRRKSVLRKEPKLLDSSFRRNYNNRLLKLARFFNLKIKSQKTEADFLIIGSKFIQLIQIPLQIHLDKKVPGLIKVFLRSDAI